MYLKGAVSWLCHVEKKIREKSDKVQKMNDVDDDDGIKKKLPGFIDGQMD